MKKIKIKHMFKNIPTKNKLYRARAEDIKELIEYLGDNPPICKKFKVVVKACDNIFLTEEEINELTQLWKEKKMTISIRAFIKDLSIITRAGLWNDCVNRLDLSSNNNIDKQSYIQIIDIIEDESSLISILDCLEKDFKANKDYIHKLLKIRNYF